VRITVLGKSPSWQDIDGAGEAPPLEAHVEADLAIVGGGFTGLWAAVQAKHEGRSAKSCCWRPRRRLGRERRNGGFVDASLTHGCERRRRFPRELDALEALGGRTSRG
jgi:glycine/D-amino acid oxidase-like deaminating enzyme